MYHQVAVELSYMHKTAFLTEYELFKLLVNSPAILWELVNTSFLQALEYFLLAYFDNLLVYSENMDLYK